MNRITTEKVSDNLFELYFRMGAPLRNGESVHVRVDGRDKLVKHTFTMPYHAMGNEIRHRSRNRNLKISKALLKSQAHQGTSLFTTAATNQRGVSKEGSREAMVRFPEYQEGTE